VGGSDGHGHAHGDLDEALGGGRAGIRAVRRSLVALAVTAALQFVIVVASGSVALLADTCTTPPTP
jgi:divalent metal cation (Fe/Co/Zn/Cd) transporter